MDLKQKGYPADMAYVAEWRAEVLAEGALPALRTGGWTMHHGRCMPTVWNARVDVMFWDAEVMTGYANDFYWMDDTEAKPIMAWKKHAGKIKGNKC